MGLKPRPFQKIQKLFEFWVQLNFSTDLLCNFFLFYAFVLFLFDSIWSMPNFDKCYGQQQSYQMQNLYTQIYFLFLIFSSLE